jgi:hypothetical protein
VTDSQFLIREQVDESRFAAASDSHDGYDCIFRSVKSFQLRVYRDSKVHALNRPPLTSVQVLPPFLAGDYQPVSGESQTLRQ